MKPDQASWTAEMAAYARALHRYNDAPLIFDDLFAVQMLSRKWRAMVRVPLLRGYGDRVLFRGLRNFRAGLVARSRYAEDRLASAVARGVQQYVILSAGFDTFLLRQPGLATQLQVFEVDHPATQQLKLERLAAAGWSPASRATFVSLDFERDTLDEALGRSGFRSQEAAFFCWVGTTYYLAPEAFRTTLRSFRAIGAPDSELVFDYMIPAGTLVTSERRRLDLTRRLGKRRSEPTQLLISAQDMKAELESAGLECVEDVSAAEMNDRYLSGRDDGLQIYPGYRYLTARRP